MLEELADRLGLDAATGRPKDPRATLGGWGDEPANISTELRRLQALARQHPEAVESALRDAPGLASRLRSALSTMGGGDPG